MKKFLKHIFISLFALSGLLFAPSTLMAQEIPLESFVPTSDSGEIYVASDPTSLFKGIANIIFVVAAAITFSYLIYGAISFITSGADVAKKTAARQRITNAVIGLLIVASVWAIYSLIIYAAFGTSNPSLPTL